MKLKTLKDIIKGTSDYGYPEACKLPEEECNKLGLETSGAGWNGAYSGEKVRIILKEEAKKWIEELNEIMHRHNVIDYNDPIYKNECNNPFISYHDGVDYVDSKNVIEWIRYFFNIKEESK